MNSIGVPVWNEMKYGVKQAQHERELKIYFSLEFMFIFSVRAELVEAYELLKHHPFVMVHCKSVLY